MSIRHIDFFWHLVYIRYVRIISRQKWIVKFLGVVRLVNVYSSLKMKQIKLYLIAILCTMLWGSAIPTIKLGYDIFNIAPAATADKFVFAGVRFLGAGLLILVPFSLFSKNTVMEKGLFRHSLILGLIQTAGQYFFMYIGLAYTTGVNTSVFNAVGTLLYIVLAWIIYRDEKVSEIKVLGCSIGFFGILLNSLATQKMGILSLRGDGFIIISSVCFAIGFLYSKHCVKNSNPFLLTGIQMGFGGLVLLAVGLIFGGKLPTISTNGIILLVYLMLVSVVAFSLWTLLLKDYPAALVGVFNFLTPIFGAVFSYVLSSLGLLNESSAFTVYTVLAIICSAGGIFLSSMSSTVNIKNKYKRRTS